MKYVRRSKGDFRTDAQILQAECEERAREKALEKDRKQIHQEHLARERERVTRLEKMEDIIFNGPLPPKDDNGVYQWGDSQYHGVLKVHPHLTRQIAETDDEFRDRIRETLELPKIKRKPNTEPEEFMRGLEGI